MIRVSALLLIVTFSLPVAAQDASARENASMDRVRRALAAPGVLRDAASRPLERPVYRIHVEGLEQRDPRIIWDLARDTAASPYARPRMFGPHHEYLSVVTPEEFRASTLAAGGTDVLGAIKSLASGRRRRAEEAERRRIRREVQMLVR